MTTYEVRERKLVYHYYNVEANSKKEAEQKAAKKLLTSLKIS